MGAAGVPSGVGYAGASLGLCGPPVLIGGLDHDGRALGEFWIWQAGAWRSIASGAPRLVTAIAVGDAAGSGVLVLGAARNANTGRQYTEDTQTWHWDGTWTQLHPAHAPDAWVEGGGLADDIANGGAVFAGGIWASTPAVQNQVWTWNGQDWSEALSDDPTGISGNRAPDRVTTGPGGRPFGFLAQAGSPSVGQLVEWEGLRFQDVTAVGAPHTATSMTLDPTRGTLVVTGSATNIAPDLPVASTATYVFDGSKWTTSPLPSGLLGVIPAASCSDAPERGVVVFGGGTSSGNIASVPAPQVAGRTWRWDGSAWSEVA